MQELDEDQIRLMLGDAIGMLTPAKLPLLAGKYFDLERLRPVPPKKGSLIAEVKAFQKASLSGKYYESFSVNSKNYMQQSAGTRTWIAECERLFKACATTASTQNAAEFNETFETLCSLLSHLDEGMDDIVFFADEGGSWQVGVDWNKVLQAWFACLAVIMQPDEYASRVIEIVDKFIHHDRNEHFITASAYASPEQRDALSKRTDLSVPKKRKNH